MTALRAELQSLSTPDLAYIAWQLRWAQQRRAKQTPPAGEWDVWPIITGRGWGKRIHVDALLPTPCGFVRNGEVRDGDWLIGSDGAPVRVVKAHPIEVAVRSYRVTFDDGSQVDADAEHQWATYTKLERKNAARRGEEPTAQVFTTEQLASSLMHGNREANHAIPVVRAVGRHLEAKIDPYVLGAWLGDGMTGEASLVCGQEDFPIFAKCAERGYPVMSVRWTSPRTDNGQSWPIYRLRNLHAALSAYGLIGAKRIPREFMRASIEQRFELLRGLMDTDGSCTAHAGMCELSLSNRDLAADAEELLLSLGFKITSNVYDSWRYKDGARWKQGKDRVRIKFMAYADEPVFSHPLKRSRLRSRGFQSARRKLRYVKAVERIASVSMRCLTVDAEDSLYCVGREFILTHNTRTGAEWLAKEAWNDPGSISAVIAPTFQSDVLETCFAGPSGLLNVIPPELIANWRSSDAHLELVNGSVIRGFSATEPERLRGPNLSRAWCDELAAWKYLQRTWDMMEFATRIGKKPQKVITTTPKPLKFIKDLMAEYSDTLTTGALMENRANLAEVFVRKIMRYDGTDIGKQEIYGELLSFEDYGIIKRRWIKLWPNDKTIPKSHFTVQSYDTAFKVKVKNDPTAHIALIVFRPDDKSPLSAMLCDAWTEKMLYPDLRDKVVKSFKDYTYDPSDRPTDAIVIEDKGSGQSLIQDLQRIGMPVFAYDPLGMDKIQRANLVSFLFKQGSFYVPESKLNPGEPVKWARPYLDQLCSFSPDMLEVIERSSKQATQADDVDAGEHDDWVDATTQAMKYLYDAGWLTTKLDLPDEPEEEQPKRVNPYAS